MPYPIPIIIGTTIVAVGSVYCFKKFVYDPHLAPLVDAVIAQHRTQAYDPISTAPVASQTSSGRSSALGFGAEKLRRRQAAEMYELEETRILQDERDLPPPPYAVRKRRVAPAKPAPTAPIVPDRETTPLVEKATQPGMTEKAEEEALIGLDATTQPATDIEKLAENSREQQRVPDAEISSPSVPSVHGAGSELLMPMPQAARPTVPLILQDDVILSPSTVSSVLSSPQLVGASEIDDDDIISLSGVSNNTASYVDAETYTPRTMSPSDFSVISSRAISPQDQGLGGLGLTQVLTQTSAGWESGSLRSDSDWEVLSNGAL